MGGGSKVSDGCGLDKGSFKATDSVLLLLVCSNRKNTAQQFALHWGRSGLMGGAGRRGRSRREGLIGIFFKHCLSHKQVHCVLLPLFWCTYMATNLSVQ